MQRRSNSDDGGDFTQPGRRKLDQVIRSLTWPEMGKLGSKWDAEVQGCINTKLALCGEGKETGRIWVEMDRNCSDEQKAWWHKKAVVNIYE